MKIKLIILCLLLALSAAPVQAQGLLQYTWAAIANQLGLDRGPVPKIVPKFPVPVCSTDPNSPRQEVRVPEIPLFAEGF